MEVSPSARKTYNICEKRIGFCEHLKSFFDQRRWSRPLFLDDRFFIVVLVESATETRDVTMHFAVLRRARDAS